MTPSKTILALLTLLTLAACEKNKDEIMNKDLVKKTSINQRPNLLSEETLIKPYWERSQSFSAGAKGKLSIVPFDESQLFKTNQVQRRMLIINDDTNNPYYVEVYSANNVAEDNLNRILSDFISFEKHAGEKMIENFEGTIMLYDKQKKTQGGFTYNKKYNKPGLAIISANHDNSRVNPPSEECWYVVLTTTYTQYFSDGTSYTWSESSIVGQYCVAPTTGSGGGTSTACSNTLSQILLGTATTDETPVASLISEDSITRTKTYSWKFYRQNQGMFYFESTETGVHKKVNNVWKWQSLTHTSITRSGSIIGGTVECLLMSATATIGQYYAGMQLKYKVKADLVCEGSPISSTTGAISSGIFISVND